MKFDQAKSFFLKTLIGCLVAAGGLAVVTVLIGQFNNVSTRALFTILLIAVHAIISFAFITNNEKQSTFESLTFFTNVTFGLIVLSFITSILGLWKLLPGDLVGKLYELYGVLLFATLHGDVLARTLNKQASIDKIVYANFFFMALVAVLLVPIIFWADSGAFEGFYYRLLAAAGIVDATLTLIAVILHKLYLHKHPQIADPLHNAPIQGGGSPGRKGLNIFVVLLLACLALQLVAGIAMTIVRLQLRN